MTTTEPILRSRKATLLVTRRTAHLPAEDHAVTLTGRVLFQDGERVLEVTHDRDLGTSWYWESDLVILPVA
jgi:hypothetical protein